MKDPAAEAQQILRERALALARPVSNGTVAPTNSLELLEFRLASERYAVESRFVQEVHPLRDLTPLPGTPPFVPGIVNVRGQILPVYDLKKLFDLPEPGLTDLHRVLHVRGHDMELGLLADVIVSVHMIAADSLQASLPTLTGIRAEYLKGITADRIVVLDLDRILSDPKIIVHDEVEN
jgi:purine-binding chemotaxis protein CheW